MTQECFQWSDFNEICDAKRDQFVRGELDATEYRRFLVRQGFNATDADSELADAKAEKIRSSIAWYRNSVTRRNSAFHHRALLSVKEIASHLGISEHDVLNTMEIEHE